MSQARRIYLDTMSKILGRTDKTVIDNSVGKGVVPYLPLPALKATGTSGVTVTEGPATAGGSQ